MNERGYERFRLQDVRDDMGNLWALAIYTSKEQFPFNNYLVENNIEYLVHSAPITKEEHIDDMANLIKEEISGEREVDNPQSDLEAYVDSLSDVFKKEIEKITLLYNRLGKFKNMLKDQEVLAAKFGNQSESRYISNNTQNDNLNKTNVPNGEINLADLDESC